MTIQLYNSRTRRKEAFKPLDRSNVRMYVCGPTVWHRAHIGNARPVVVFDVLYRLLRHLAPEMGWGKVTYVRNITDVDDKIIARAQETLRPGETLEAATRRITDETIGWYHDDMKALGALPPTHEPRCTEYIPQMVEMTRALIEKGAAYVAEGHVLFEVAKWPRYGELSGRSTDDMIAGARVEVAPYKRSPMDFVLWKPSTPDQPGWDSPWGRGRPGWHIECSAMAEALLGHEFDIHGGGIDLQFPHHENELAQSCCVHATERMAQVWMHNGFLQVEGEKMSKSLGNFFTVRDLLDRNPKKYGFVNLGPAIRLRLLHTHYRKPLDWTERGLEEATIALDKFRHALQGAEPGPDWEDHEINDDGFIDALSDDLNVSEAYAIMHETADRLKRAGLTVDQVARYQALLWRYCEFLGFSKKDLNQYDLNEMAAQNKAATAEESPQLTALIERLLADRQQARRSKDFARADAIRARLDAAGVVIMDRPNAATDWELSPHFDPAKLEALP